MFFCFSSVHLARATCPLRHNPLTYAPTPCMRMFGSRLVDLRLFAKFAPSYALRKAQRYCALTS